MRSNKEPSGAQNKPQTQTLGQALPRSTPCNKYSQRKWRPLQLVPKNV